MRFVKRVATMYHKIAISILQTDRLQAFDRRLQAHHSNKLNNDLQYSKFLVVHLQTIYNNPYRRG